MSVRNRLRKLFDLDPVYPSWMKAASAVALLGVALGLTVFAALLPGYAGLAIAVASVGSLMGAVAVAALQTGWVKIDPSGSEYTTAKPSVASRDREPFGFWSGVVFYLCIAGLCYGLAVVLALA